IVASKVERVGFNLIDQRRARNPELLRGARAVAPVDLERPLVLLAFHIGERQRRVTPLAAPSTPTTSAPTSLSQVRREVLDADLRHPAAQDHSALEHVAHLAHVARPRRRQEAVQRLGAAHARAPRHLRPQIEQDPGDQREAVFPRALAYRREPWRAHPGGGGKGLPQTPPPGVCPPNPGWCP